MKNKVKLVLFLLLSSSFHRVESPPHHESGCSHNDDYEDCTLKYEKCMRDNLETTDCHDEQCECFKKFKSSRPECENKIKDVCTQHGAHGVKIATTGSVIDKLDTKMKILKNPMGSLKNHCFEESAYNNSIERIKNSMPNTNDIFNQKVVPSFVITQLVHSSNQTLKCKASTERLVRSMEWLDASSMSKMPFSFDQSHCGWALGDLTRIILRAVTAETIPNFVGDFNHCCAIERDCFIRGINLSDCGKSLETCTMAIEKMLKRNKSNAIVMAQILMSISSWTSILVSENKTRTDVSYVTYSMNTEKGFTGVDSFNNADGAALNLLWPNDDFEENVHQSFKDVYKVCKPHQAEISSCLYRFIYCKNSNLLPVSQCSTDAENCFSNIASEDKECIDAVRDVGRALGPLKATWTTWIWNVLERIWDAVLTAIVWFVVGTIWKWGRKHYNQCCNQAKYTQADS